jgi:rubrerythrin
MGIRREQMKTAFEKIISFAIEKEKEAAELYEKMSGLARKPNAKAMFNELKAEEVKHRKSLEGMTEESVPDLPLQEVADLKISDYLVEVDLRPDMDYQDILIVAMKREESAVKLYNDMAEKAQSPRLQKLLKFMSQEEARHKLRLETEYDENVLRED